MNSLVISMGAILLPILIYLISFPLLLTPNSNKGTWLPPTNNIAKRDYEIFALRYSIVWISIFAVVIVTQAYENFTENGYMALCGSLAAPLLLQPFLLPTQSEKTLPFHLRYSFKATLWIAIFSFIGNYWYTHYFYSVLQAKYTFPAHRTNNVPISMFFATHFYFITYHTFSNMLLRAIETSYVPSTLRTIYFWSTVCAFSYFTAFMETLTISSFPYYSFPLELQEQVYTHGSAFYGLYFIASFPLFYRLDEYVGVIRGVRPHTVFQTVIEVSACGMIVLQMLDFCRLYMNIPLLIKGKLFELTKN